MEDFNFSERLKALMDRSAPDGRPWTDASVAKAASARGLKLSPSYVGQLRTGERPNPSVGIIRALASVFDVPVGYLAGETQADDEVTRALDVLRKHGVETVYARGGTNSIPLETVAMIAHAIRQSTTPSTAPVVE
mgnify:CR=1 FL=1